MKNLLCSLLAFTFFSVAMPVKKAEAGFMILAATQEFVWKHKYETLDTVLVIALPVTMITTGIFAVGIAGNPFNNATLVAGAICLDENLELNRNAIEDSLLANFKFLEDKSERAELASVIAENYEVSEKSETGVAMVKVSAEEIATAVPSASEAQLAELSAKLN